MQTDVAIIGAGIYGCSVAYFLSRFGVDTVVIDTGDIGGGASGANAGNIHLQLSPFTHAMKSREWVAEFAHSLPFFIEAHALWQHLAHELAMAIELRCPGGIMVAETEHQLAMLHDKVALERAHGLEVRMLSSSEISQVAPYLSRQLIGASYCPNEGMANALGAVVALADAARAAGIRFMLSARVSALTACGNGWQIETKRGSVRSERVVIAAGTWSNEVATMAAAQLPLTQRLIQMIATEPCQRFIEHLVYHSEHRLTLKQVSNGNVLIGGGWTARSGDVYGQPAVLRDSVLGSLQLAARIVPQLRSAAVIRAWAGPNAYTPDGRPILGEIPRRDGLYAAVCNTYGFTLGPLCGLLVAQMLAGRDTTVSTLEFQPARFDSAGLAG